MAKYIPYDFRQSTLVEIDFLKQLQHGTFELASHYHNDTTGRRAYNPSTLLKTILLAHSKAITSSREIMWHCQTNINFKALACYTVPHFTTIAHLGSG
jgi:transposase